MTTTTRRLNVWRANRLIGTFDQTRSGLRFCYTHESVEHVGLGRPLISTSMPTSIRPFFDRIVRPYFDGLLPEGEARRIIAYDLRLSEADTFGLLRSLGRDCAGALAIIPADDGPPVSESVATLEPLSPGALDKLIRNLRFNPLGLDDNLRVSLAGVQEKLVLTALPGDRWALPTAAVASTHILKPAITGLDGSATNEALCLRFAAESGASAATARVQHLGGRDVLIVARFDRTIDNHGLVHRIHQETACQALSTPVAATARKYEDSGGPTMHDVAAVARRWTGPEQLDRLLQQLTVNIVVGNADAHAMNISFMLQDSTEVHISPLYDVLSTLAYPTLSTTAGMFVNGVSDVRLVTRDDLVSEAVGWGMPTDRAASVVEAVCRDAGAALDRACEAIPTAPTDLVALLCERVASFSDR